MLLRADLHLHTCLSPCGGYDVTPAAVVTRSSQLGLDLIAVSDHNSAENVRAARRAAERLGPAAPRVLAGMEITSAEEVHLLALFEDMVSALTLQAMVFDHLPPDRNKPDVFGEQIVANADDEVEGFNQRLLIGATDLGVSQWVDRVHGLGGLVIAAHIDRPSYSLVGQLGMIPPDLKLDGVEVSAGADPVRASIWLGPSGLPVITCSDAHCLEDIGRVWTELEMDEPTLAELDLALRGQRGRCVLGWGRREAAA